MDVNDKRTRVTGVAGLIAAAAVIGGVLGTSEAASAATTAPVPPAASQSAPADLFSATPVRTGEKALGASDAAKVTAAAEAAVDGASVFRVETDADGEAFEAHMKKAGGSVVTVTLDANFAVTGTLDGFGPGGPGDGGPGHGGHGAGGPGALPGSSAAATSTTG